MEAHIPHAQHQLLPTLTQPPQWVQAKPQQWASIKASSQPKDQEHIHLDPFRDGMTRYLGFTNEVATALRKWINPANSLTALYAAGDVFYKGIRQYNYSNGQPQHIRVIESLDRATEAGLFQGIATYYLPKEIVHWVGVKAEQILKMKGASAGQIKILPKVAALGSIPFIIKPIDTSMEYLLHKLYVPAVVKLKKTIIPNYEIYRGRQPVAKVHLVNKPPINRSDVFQALFE